MSRHLRHLLWALYRWQDSFSIPYREDGWSEVQPQRAWFERVLLWTPFVSFELFATSTPSALEGIFRMLMLTYVILKDGTDKLFSLPSLPCSDEKFRRISFSAVSTHLPSTLRFFFHSFIALCDNSACRELLANIICSTNNNNTSAIITACSCNKDIPYKKPNRTARRDLWGKRQR